MATKLTEEKVRDIHRMVSLGVSRKKVAEEFGVCNSTIDSISKRETWAHMGLDIIVPARLANRNFGLSVKERLETGMEVDENTGCHIWIRGKDPDGYGRLKSRNKTDRAHRLSYETYVGEIPKGLMVLHKCDNPSCINPSHLFLGDQRENIGDMLRKGRSNYAKGEKSGSAKLKESDIIRIVSCFVRNVSDRKIAKDFQTTRANVQSIRKGKTWGWLTGLTYESFPRKGKIRLR